MSESGKKNHSVRAGSAISAVRFSQSLTAAIDVWAEAHQVCRGDAIQLLVELGLKVAPAAASHGSKRQDPVTIEGEAVNQITALLDPSLPPEERQRRIRRLIEGPPEFAEQRIDLPKPPK